MKKSQTKHKSRFELYESATTFQMISSHRKLSYNKISFSCPGHLTFKVEICNDINEWVRIIYSSFEHLHMNEDLITLM